MPIVSLVGAAYVVRVLVVAVVPVTLEVPPCTKAVAVIVTSCPVASFQAPGPAHKGRRRQRLK